MDEIEAGTVPAPPRVTAPTGASVAHLAVTGWRGRTYNLACRWRDLGEMIAFGIGRGTAVVTIAPSGCVCTECARMLAREAQGRRWARQPLTGTAR